MFISTPYPSIACKHARWRRNRDVIEGEDAVKKRRTCYLPLASVNQSDTAEAGATVSEYQLYLDNVVFFPAANRTLELLVGLIFRKRPVLSASAVVDELANEAVTPDGLTVEQLARKVVRETLITNFTGLLVDHPSADDFQGLSRANAFERGFRPFVSLYEAESILEAQYGVVRNRRRLVYVRLLDDCDNVRELSLEEGVYVQRKHQRLGTGWQLVEEVMPLRNGAPMAEIPFVIVSTEDEHEPQPALMDHSVNLNLHHYRIQGKLALAHMFLSSPIPWVAGAQTAADDEPLAVAPGSLWEFEDKDTKCGYLEFEGTGIGSIERERDKIELHLATVGARILSSEPNGIEAAETARIKRASENSALAASARTISQNIKKALDWFAQWVDGSEAEFSLNTHFIPGTMSAQELTSLVALVQGGILSRETAFLRLRDGEVVDETLTYEDEKARLALDGPLAAPAP